MTKTDKLQNELRAAPRKWLVTGCAGFIGSNLLETLLKADQIVAGLDNFSTGYEHNLTQVRELVSAAQWQRFSFINGDIRDLDVCKSSLAGVDSVLHQAALGSVPRSLNDPICTNDSNVNGFLNMLVASRDAKVKSFVYAASSSTYGDHPGLPKVEDKIGNALSPYAVTKYVNELYADVFSRCYGFGAVGLRYFNVFGKRQDPNGGYAAVIPKWIDSMISGDAVVINGDGSTSRDFCYIENVVQANLLAALTDDNRNSRIYNIAVNEATDLNCLFTYIKDILYANGINTSSTRTYAEFRAGDVRHSQADIGKAKRELNYEPQKRIYSGLEAAIPWYIERSMHGR